LRSAEGRKFGGGRDVDLSMVQRLLVISPVRNEAAHLELVAAAVERQTRPPDRWVLVDDGSTDGTGAILAQLGARCDFVEVIPGPSTDADAPVRDRLAAAAAPRAFNRGLHSVDWASFTHIAKLDGDIELPPDYFERLLREFERDRELGMAGGVWSEPDRASGVWKAAPIPLEFHVMGSMKCYTLECFRAIGGMQERLGWDTIDQTYARMQGFRTRSFPELVARHHRPWGSADGVLRGRARHGRCAYIAHYPAGWVTMRAFKAGRSRPRGVSGLAFLYGYLHAGLTRTSRVEDAEFRRFVRAELRNRARSEISQRVTHGRRLAQRPLRAR